MRRPFLRALAAGAALSLGGARAQTPPVVGYLSGVSEHESAGRVAGLQRGLAQAGLAEGRSYTLAYRWADGDYGRLPALADELARLPVRVLVATGGSRAAVAAREAARRVPVVFTMGADPVQLGLVASLARPGGNITGVNFLTQDLTPKRLDLLREIVPRARRVVLLVNPATPSTEFQIRLAQQWAHQAGVVLELQRASNPTSIDSVFAVLARNRPEGLVVATDAFLAARRQQLIAHAARLSIPTVYEGRESVADGGLASYGPDISAAHAQAGAYVARILAGARPAELPVVQATQFELVLNTRTARALGLTLPQPLLLRADEVIA